MVVAIIIAVVAGILMLAAIASVGWSVIRQDDGSGFIGGGGLGVGSFILFFLAMDMTGLTS